MESIPAALAASISRSSSPIYMHLSGITFNKKEGDLKTPKGTFNLRYVMYRADKIKKPKTKLWLEISRETLRIINLKYN